MGQLMVKQPDGLWAVWSTCIDNFILFDGKPSDVALMLDFHPVNFMKHRPKFKYPFHDYHEVYHSLKNKKISVIDVWKYYCKQAKRKSNSNYDEKIIDYIKIINNRKNNLW